ncbi:hypothetical protein [Sporomusa sp.]|jgi:hypothetical protein|uniref:hypothetical protein n=1 Tax=Sporomusa sp. TaxID=2078658 RepID=UPI002BB8AE76|nr:hypothetical protein [Sporomusa sp.]HWR07047.1 hypothetical protein [Sporomusa sp.]
MSDFTSFWYSDDMEEQVAVSDGEFLLLNTNTRKVEKLGSTFEEAKESLKVLGKFENFSDFQ